MRHAVRGRKLGRTSAHREALFRNQLQSLFDNERIITTLPKAKELRPLAEKIITHGKQSDSVPARRWVLTRVLSRDVVKKVFDEISPRFKERPGGYLRIVKLGPRLGDGAEMAVLEMVDREEAKAAAPEAKETPKETKPRVKKGEVDAAKAAKKEAKKPSRADNKGEAKKAKKDAGPTKKTTSPRKAV
jgi:large subunit ribosomal protein L17